jgi:hypothetical protein
VIARSLVIGAEFIGVLGDGSSEGESTYIKDAVGGILGALEGTVGPPGGFFRVLIGGGERPRADRRAKPLGPCLRVGIEEGGELFVRWYEARHGRQS